MNKIEILQLMSTWSRSKCWVTKFCLFLRRLFSPNFEFWNLNINLLPDCGNCSSRKFTTIVIYYRSRRSRRRRCSAAKNAGISLFSPFIIFFIGLTYQCPSITIHVSYLHCSDCKYAAVPALFLPFSFSFWLQFALVSRKVFYLDIPGSKKIPRPTRHIWHDQNRAIRLWSWQLGPAQGFILVVRVRVRRPLIGSISVKDKDEEWKNQTFSSVCKQQPNCCKSLFP